MPRDLLPRAHADAGGSFRFAVARPRAVRYGFLNFPVVKRWNKEGLRAAPF